MVRLPEIPKTYLVVLLVISLVLMRCFGIDSFTTAALSSLIGYITGQQIEQSKHVQTIEKEKKEEK